jgi:hypothetical protein
MINDAPSRTEHLETRRPVGGTIALLNMFAAASVDRPSRKAVSPRPSATADKTAGTEKTAQINPLWHRLATYTEAEYQGGPQGGQTGQAAATAGPPPVLDSLTVAVPGPVTAEATLAIRPHMHLGVKTFGPSGVVFTGRTIGGPTAGGELFFSQVIRDSVRQIRIGRGLSTDTVKDELDGGQIYKGTTAAASSGNNVISETDTPGATQSASATDSRFTFHFNDKFETFLMWRADATSPASSWLTYGSVDWSWDATATGVTSDSKNIWLAPTEPFHVCGKALLSGGSLSIKNHKPTPATHLGLPVHLSGTSAPTPATVAFPSDSAKDTLEQNCP